ncbi:MAG: aminopeptidase P N-terminal domain-containing protein [Rhodocyclaceae bacterium]
MEMRAFSERRQRLIEKMGRGIALVPTAPERVRNRDTHHPYRFDSYFYYLTGFREPDAALVLIAGDEPQSILFCREKDPEREIWEGFRHGPEAARELFGFDAAFPIGGIEEKLAELAADRGTLFYSIGHDAAWDARAIAALNAVREKQRSGVAAPSRIEDVRVLLDEMRLFKDAQELDAMRRAARISARAHRRAMLAAAPGRREYELEAELLHEFRACGSASPAYPAIVASGANACVLHYVANDGVLREGDLVLIDAACEIDGYAADITRCFPAGGRFGPAQRDIYALVLAAQAAAIGCVAPGRSWDEPHQAALRVIVQGLIDMKLVEGTVDAAIASGAYKRFYMHRTGHWLGLDVHDAGAYKCGGDWRSLAPGMTLTVEPGCYIRPGEGVPEALENIGVRIEDDVLVTEEGCEILSADAVKSIEDIETLMGR